MARKIILKENGLSGSGSAPNGYKYLGDNAGDISEKVGATVSGIGGMEYKVYSALLTQSGTGNPVATVFTNTLDSEITYGRNSAGSYFVSCLTPGKFPQQKTAFLFQHTSNNMRVTRSGDDLFLLTTNTNNSTTAADNILNQTFIEIRVYP